MANDYYISELLMIMRCDSILSLIFMAKYLTLCNLLTRFSFDESDYIVIHFTIFTKSDL